MSTQVIRNLLNNQVDSVIIKAKNKVKEEGKKQLNKLKQQIPTPQEIQDNLSTDINTDSCSPEGQQKFKDKHDNTLSKIDSIKKALDRGINTLENLKESLDKILGSAGVLSKIEEFPQVLNPTVSTLEVIVQAASAIITGVGFIPPPSTFPAGPQIIAKDAAKVASGTISEFSQLINSIPDMINIYKSKANSVLGMIDSSLKNLYILKDKLDKLIAYSKFIELKFAEDCEDLLDGGNSGVGNGLGGFVDGNQINNINDLTLEQLIAATQEVYGNILDNLIAQGDSKAVERIYIINREMEEWKTKYNISFKIIYI